MKKNLAIAALLVIAAVIYLQRPKNFLSEDSAADKKSIEEKAVVAEEFPQAPAVPVTGALAESPPGVSLGEEKPILGQKVRLREVREDGELVNLTFVIRQGILPRRLLEDGGRKLLSYDELYHNSVGYGAATAWLLYRLQSEAGVEVAVSRPDGSDFQVLARNLEQVLDFEHLPAQNRVRLKFLQGGAMIERDYALPSS